MFSARSIRVWVAFLYTDRNGDRTILLSTKWLFRYVDNSHVCLKKKHVDELHSHLNSINPHFKFTIEVETESSTAFYIQKQLDKRMVRSLFLSTEKPPYLGGQRTNTCDFQCDCCRVLQCNFRRKCKLAAISPRFRCDICRNFPQITVQLFETSAISRRQIAQKSPQVYTCNFYRELERKKKLH